MINIRDRRETGDRLPFKLIERLKEVGLSQLSWEHIHALSAQAAGPSEPSRLLIQPGPQSISMVYLAASNDRTRRRALSRSRHCIAVRLTPRRILHQMTAAAP